MTSGHALADVARTVVLIRYGQPPDGPGAAAIDQSFRAAFVDDYWLPIAPSGPLPTKN